MTDQLDTIAREEDAEVPFVFLGHTYKMRKRIKRLKFLRLINTDPTGALLLCFPEAEYERLEDLDLDADEMRDLLTRIAEEFAGSAPNAGPSPRP
jgi:hypothetical protein